jgi:hypothetical protein
VVDFYDRGGDFSDNLDPLIFPLRLQPHERDELSDFVANALVDPRVENEQFPFDRPTLYSERNANNPRVYGRGSRGSGNLEPAVIAVTPPNLGNWDFKFGLTNALGASPAWAILSYASVPSGTRYKGILVNIDLDQIALVMPATTLGAGAGGGYATFGGELPNDPSYAGLDFYAQWFVADPAGPSGFSSSPGIEFTLF